MLRMKLRNILLTIREEMIFKKSIECFKKFLVKCTVVNSKKDRKFDSYTVSLLVLIIKLWVSGSKDWNRFLYIALRIEYFEERVEYIRIFIR